MSRFRSWPHWIWWSLLMGLVLVAVAGWHLRQQKVAPPPGAFIALLLPDQLDSHKYILAWQDAASEAGVSMAQITASELVAMDAAQRARIRGIVLPDSIHRSISAALAGVLEEYVRNGGALWINYDAATEDAGGRFLDKPSLARLVGVDYLLYQEMGKAMVHGDQMLMSAQAVQALGIAPGRFQATGSDPEAMLQAATYGYDKEEFSHLLTRGLFPGQVLATSKDGSLIAGLRRYGQGQVLFVNLPVTFLRVRTDGLWLQSYLRFFNGHMLKLPQLASVPDGIGGLVMNWHVDANNALPYMSMLEGLGFLKQGPYSVHFTSGPDNNSPGDRLGMDVAHNITAQGWIRRLHQLGYEVGAHGGWAHNYFAFNINEHDGSKWTSYLVNNKKDLENVTHQQLTEYSAPNGHHPQWVTNWLRRNGVLAYYFVGDSSMGPTRAYIDPDDMHGRPWAFPVSANGDVASFEEAVRNKFSESQMSAWLEAMTGFTVRQREVRLVYFHPPGVYFYQNTARQWLEQTQQLREQGVFRWYTMTQLARFLTQREQTVWQVLPVAGAKQPWITVNAHNPASLQHQSWLLPKTKARPVLLSGVASIEDLPDAWRITARSGKDLRFEYLQPTSTAQGAGHD